MARPKSEDKRNAILAAATRVIAMQGLGAPTATIAHEAGVANGTLFTYFETKADLLNHLYLELKAQMVGAVSMGQSDMLEPRERLFLVWQNWMRWAVAYPEKRKALAQLNLSDEITPETRIEASTGMAQMIELMEQIRSKGPMVNAPQRLVAEMMTSLADVTIDYTLSDPGNAEAHCATGFEALWRMIGGS
jgi:AcrR family transcriptional regulator